MVDAKEARLKDRYQRWLAELGILDDIEKVVDVFTVRKELLGTVIDEGNYEYLDTDSVHHFVGVMVTFSARTHI